MNTRRLSTFFIFCTTLAACMTTKRMIYLGPKSESLFLSGELTPMNFEGSYEFLGYQTFRHDPVNQKNNQVINRLGLFLSAKRTENLTTTAEAVFGKNDNTSLVVYEANVKKVTKGRSAFLSILNLFSREEDKQPQEEPTAYVNGIDLNGKISLDEKVAEFIFGKKTAGDAGCKDCVGKIWYSDDSLSIKIATNYINKKGKKKKGQMGLLLQKSNSIYAAINKFHNPPFVYINSTISEDEKLLAATCLFIIATYLHYNTPFIDMIPH